MKNFDEISLDNIDNQELLEKQSYQDYLRKENFKKSNDKRIKKFLSNNTYYLAVKQLPDLEKTVFCLTLLRNKKLDYLCKSLKTSKKDIIQIKKSAIKHFIKNVKNIKKDSISNE